MHIKKIDIMNFRMLRKVDFYLEERTTVIVGRNNSGKTSLTELFRRLLSDSSPTFRLEDFTLSAYEQFWNAFLLKCLSREDNEIREALPFIEVKLTISYEKSSSSLGLLGDFIIDLNPYCIEALIVIRYRLKDGEIDAFFDCPVFNPNEDNVQQKDRFFKVIKERLQQCYEASVLAEDPNDPTNQKVLDLQSLRALIQSGFINAQRGLDDETYRDRAVLGNVLEALFNNAMSDSSDPKDRDTAEKLKQAVEGMQQGIDTNFNGQLTSLFPAFSLFGYPGLSDPGLRTETTLDMERLLKNHTKVHYAGINGINLPEAYNGLGARNLIFILLKLLEFFKSFTAKQGAPGIHFVFIEEPEVHLHPQMQEVFISKLEEIADVFAKEFNNGLLWPVQFVVTTHSTHIANEAPFDSMRYFLATQERDSSKILTTQIKDLRNGLGGELKNDQDFLHKYMTLTRSDLFFADKAILIEGLTERLMLPKMVEKIDAEQSDVTKKLSSQYFSVVEIGGAYAHRFFNLLKFLELRTLVITDLDAVKKNAANKLVACTASEGSQTSNGCIKDWFGDSGITPAALIQKSGEEKTHGIRRLAYQVPESVDNPCGRSFEDAFFLANPGLFGLSVKSVPEMEEDTWNKAKEVTKSAFALEYAIDKTEWQVPRYIADGLRWLAEGGRRSTAAPSMPSSAPTLLAENTPQQEKSND